MAVLHFPRFFSLLPTFPSSPPPQDHTKTLTLRRGGRRCCCSASAVEMSAATAILWYKHDLRIDDHPGLLLAAAPRFRTVVPLYVFDRRILSRFSDEMLELLLLAVEDLRNSLKDCGSNLMIRFGSAENVLLELVREVKATEVFAEEEVEYDLLRMMNMVEENLKTVSFAEGTPKLLPWNTPFYDIKNLKDLPQSYRDFERLKLPVLPPLLPPKLPDLMMNLDWGALPTLDDLEEFLNNDLRKSKDTWNFVKKTSAEDLLQKDQLATSNKPIESVNLPNSEQINGSSADYKWFEIKRPENSAFLTRHRNSAGGGTSLVLNALAAYLRYLEGTIRADWQEVHEKLCSAESREGASFGALFGSALHLGIISRRRVYYEAIKYEKQRNAGFLSPFGFSAPTISAAVATVQSMEWYWLLASKSQIIDAETSFIRIWRWKGYLVEYTVAGHEGPAILLVHGFGAFFRHYRDNISKIAENGNRVWAITLLGFGRSEKPNVVYTELLWAELLRDFIVDVVCEPVHLVGNSIGGYLVAILSNLWPSLAKSVVLVNSAGNAIPEYSSVPYSKDRETSGATGVVARLLLLYLRLRIKNIVKNFYPTNTNRADGWLIDEMVRSSYDPGVLAVVESIFSLNLSIPLNYLLAGLEERVLIIEGIKDPLSDSKSKLLDLKEHCKGIAVREVDAGHCPHDERPEEVNVIIQEWVTTVESRIFSVSNR